jgi:hypothetical protein
VKIFIPILCFTFALPAVARAQDGSDRFPPGRESWSYFDSWGPLRPTFRGAVSFDLSIEPGSAAQRRAELVLHFPGGPGDDSDVGESRHYDARAVRTGPNLFRIEGLPKFVVGDGESLVFSFPTAAGRRAFGPMSLKASDGREVRSFQMHPIRLGTRTIDSPEPIKPVHGPMAEEEPAPDVCLADPPGAAPPIFVSPALFGLFGRVGPVWFYARTWDVWTWPLPHVYRMAGETGVVAVDWQVFHTQWRYELDGPPPRLKAPDPFAVRPCPLCARAERGAAPGIVVGPSPFPDRRDPFSPPAPVQTRLMRSELNGMISTEIERAEAPFALAIALIGVGIFAMAMSGFRIDRRIARLESASKPMALDDWTTEREG